MSRHKGVYKDWQRRRDYPHEVEIAIPSGVGAIRPRPMDEWSRRYSNMLLWCLIRVGSEGYCMTGRFERETIRDYVQFRFRDAAIAEEFGAVYGE